MSSGAIEPAPAEARHCLVCDYVLDHLDEDRCPECGHAFDPTDKESYRAAGERRIPSGKLLLWVSGGAWAAFGLFLLVAENPCPQDVFLAMLLANLALYPQLVVFFIVRRCLGNKRYDHYRETYRLATYSSGSFLLLLVVVLVASIAWGVLEGFF